MRRAGREQAGPLVGPTASKTLALTARHKHKMYSNAHRSRVMTATPFSSSRNFTSCKFRGGPSISSCALGGCDETEWMAWVPAAVPAGGRGRWRRPKRLDGFGEEERRGRRRTRRRPAVVVAAMCCLWGGWVRCGAVRWVGVSDGRSIFFVLVGYVYRSIPLPPPSTHWPAPSINSIRLKPLRSQDTHCTPKPLAFVICKQPPEFRSAMRAIRRATVVPDPDPRGSCNSKPTHPTYPPRDDPHRSTPPPHLGRQARGKRLAVPCVCVPLQQQQQRPALSSYSCWPGPPPHQPQVSTCLCYT